MSTDAFDQDSKTLDCPYMFKEELPVENCNEDRARHVSQNIRSSGALRSVTSRGWGHVVGKSRSIAFSFRWVPRIVIFLRSTAWRIIFDSTHFVKHLLYQDSLLHGKVTQEILTEHVVIYYFTFDSESVHSDIRIVTDNLSMSRIFDEQTRIYKDEKRNASYQEKEWDHS